MAPGYKVLVQKAYAAQGHSSMEKFAEAHPPLKWHQVNRWLKTMPESHNSLLAWAKALTLDWRDLVTTELGEGASSVHRVEATYHNQEVGMPAPIFESLWPRIAHLYTNGQENGKWKLFEDLLNQLVPPNAGATENVGPLPKTGTDHRRRQR